MADKRNPEFWGVAGLKGVGKTFITTKVLKQYVVGTKFMQPRKVLIYDVNDEFQVKTIALKYLRLFAAHPKIEARRVVAKTNTGRDFSIDEKQEVLDYILHNFSNGMLLLEDFYNYTSDSMKRDVIGTLSVQRHKNLDVILHSQGLGRLFHPKLVQQYTGLRLHLTEDRVSMYKDRIKERYEIISIAENLVVNQNKKLPEKKKWFFCYIKFDTRKILGEFTKEQLLDAIDSYIYNNENDTVKRVINLKDMNGKKKYTYQQAFSKVRLELLETFYGN